MGAVLMKYRQLGKTGLMVSPICLGTTPFGKNVDRDLAFWQLDAFTERGANFIDTARVYGIPATGEKALSEKIIGEWLKRSGKRDMVIIMTKGAHQPHEDMNISRCSPENIEADIEESLQALGIERIDLYLLHRDNQAVPVGPLLEALEKARLGGKIGHCGFSNWVLSRAREAEGYALKAGIEGFTCNQVMWSLADINAGNMPDKTMVPMDRDTYKWHCDSGCALVAYSSTAKGFFSKLAKGQDIPEKLTNLYDNETNKKIFLRLKEAARDLNLSVHDLSLAYMRDHPFPSLPTSSFSRKEQLEEALRSCEVVLPPGLMAEFNALKGYRFE